MSDAIVSPDGRRLAYLVDEKRLVVTDTKTGTDLVDVQISDRPHLRGTQLDFDGRWAVVSRIDTRGIDPLMPLPTPILVDTEASDPVAIELTTVHGQTTLDRGHGLPQQK